MTKPLDPASSGGAASALCLSLPNMPRLRRGCGAVAMVVLVTGMLASFAWVMIATMPLWAPITQERALAEAETASEPETK